MSDTVLSESKGALVQEVADNTEFLKIHRKKHAGYKIVYEALQECVRAASKTLEDELKAKLRDVLLEHSCAQLLPLESDGFSFASKTLLGINGISETQIGFNELLKLRGCAALVLQRRHDSICDTFRKVTKRDIHHALAASPVETLSFALTSSECCLLEHKRRLVEAQNSYLQNLVKEQEILGRFAELRLERLPRKLDEKVEECALKSKINALRVRIVQENMRIDVFNETSNSLQAYQAVVKDIKRQREECNREVADLRRLKERYSQVSCRQFDELLKSYIQHERFLEKKKMMYDMLK